MSSESLREKEDATRLPALPLRLWPWWENKMPRTLMAPTTLGSLHPARPALCLLLHLWAVQEQLLALPDLSCQQWEDPDIWLWGRCLSCSIICLGIWKSEHPKFVISLCYYRNLRNGGLGKEILNPVYFLKSIMESKRLNPQSKYIYFFYKACKIYFW